jgi:hypothetical protein
MSEDSATLERELTATTTTRIFKDLPVASDQTVTTHLTGMLRGLEKGRLLHFGNALYKFYEGSSRTWTGVCGAEKNIPVGECHSSTVSIPNSEISEIRKGLNELRKLPPDWNGSETVQIKPICFLAAYSFAFSAENWARENYKRIPIVHVAPTPSGGVLMQWFGKETQGRELILSFKANPSLNRAFYAVDEASDYELEGAFLSFEDIVSHFSWLIG